MMGVLVWIITTVSNFIFGFMQMLAIPSVFQEHAKEFDLILLANPLIPLLLWNLGAGTEMGSNKFGRITIGVATYFSLFGIFGHVLISFTSSMVWYKVMSLNMIGVTPEQKLSMARGITVLPLLVWLVVGFLLARYLFSTGDVLEKYLAATPLKLKLKFNFKTLEKMGLNVNVKEESFFGRLFKEKVKPPDGLIEGNGDLVIGIDRETKKPAVIKANPDLTMNVGIFGSIGSGKTAGVLDPSVTQHIRNMDVGGIVMEPKGTWLRSVPKGDNLYSIGVYEVCRRFGREADFVNPHDEDTAVFNPLVGHPDIAAESVRIALRSLYGDTEGFFDGTQGLVTVQIIKLLKYMAGDKVTLDHFGRMLREPDLLYNNVVIFKKRLDKAMSDNLGKNWDVENALANWFLNKYYGDLEKQYQEFTMGLQVQMERLLSNEFFRRCVIPDKTKPNQRIIDLDKHLQSRNWLLINTDDGLLGDYSKVLARLFLVPLQYAVQRRFNYGTPGLHPIYIDELGTYIYSEFVVFATKSREYNCPLITAFQSLGQLKEVGGKQNNIAFHDTMLGTLNNKIICSRLVHADVQYFSKSLGTVKEMQKTYSSDMSGKVTSLIPERSGKREAYQEKEVDKFKINDVKFMKANEIIYEILNNRELQQARVATTSLVDKSNFPECSPDDLTKARISATIRGAEDFVVPKLDNEKEVAAALATSKEIKKEGAKPSSPVKGKTVVVSNKGSDKGDGKQSGTISPHPFINKSRNQTGTKDDLLGK
jgi:hypothetical protein